MRKVVFGCAHSLDNYIAREDGSVDWLLWGPEAADIMKTFWKTIDTLLMGRKTYDFARENAPSGGDNAYKSIRSVVFSRTLSKDEAPGVEVVSDDAVGFLRSLKEEPGKDICLMSGGALACEFLDAGLVDEIGLNVHPVLLGRGIPLFRPMSRQVDLELAECRPFANGCVYVTYRVKC